MKVFFVLEVKISVLGELFFAKSRFLAFAKSNILNLVKFRFLANFSIVNRFLISSLILSLLPLLSILLSSN